jgi:hypothetical protein
MLTHGGPGGLAGHFFDSLEKAESWLSQKCVAKSYGLIEVSLSPRYCYACKRPTPKRIRVVHKVGGMAKEDA